MTKKSYIESFSVSKINFTGIFDNKLFSKAIAKEILKSPLAKKISYVAIGSLHGYRIKHSDVIQISLHTCVEKAQEKSASKQIYSRSYLNRTTKTYYYDLLSPIKGVNRREYRCYSDETDNIPCMTIKLGNVEAARVYYPNTINILIENLFMDGAYILADISVLTKILRESLEYLSLSEKEFYNKIFLNDMEQFHKVIYKALGKEMDKSRKMIEQYNEKIETLASEMSDIREKINIETKKLEGFEDIQRSIFGKLLEELEYIKNLKGVKSVDDISSLADGMIRVHTDDIYVKNQRSRYYLGSYIIEIDIVKGAVWFKNTSEELRRHSAWGQKCHHPHCDQNGHPCLGNIQVQVAELLKSFDLSFLVNLCLSYLSSVNINDTAGKNIVNWPLVDSNGSIINESNEDGLIKCLICREFMPDEENDGWAKCEVCGEWACGDHITQITTKDGIINLCTSCKASHAQCHICGNYENRSLMIQCEVCNHLVCPDCVQQLNTEEHGKVYNQDGQIVTNICLKHNVIKCSECGINIIEGCDCPQCGGIITISHCEFCGKDIVGAMPEDSGQIICDECKESLEVCCFCGRYDSRENLQLDFALNIYKHEVCPATNANTEQEEGEE